ncbi:MAG: glutamate-5-semialdehyde dehydrogenase, partial [Acidobacteria bacterium]|nr:glutamate-5-semialdehyde dehydrogenase [Acidobacteriota bacterium]
MAGGAAIRPRTLQELERARRAAAAIAEFSNARKNALLHHMADELEAQSPRIAQANEDDIRRAGLSGGVLDRLRLTASRISAVAESVRQVASLPDPLEQTISEWTRPNGLRIRKVRVPLGVVGIVYESRPNVTVDAAVLAFKAGNAVVLRGGREASGTNEVLVEILTSVPGVPEGAIVLLDASTRASVQELITARDLVDVVIPRGGPALITHVVENALVPVIETGAGNCHIFVDESADLDMASRIVLNAKTSRPSVCNAAEKLLVHKKIAAKFVPRVVQELTDAGVEVRGDKETVRLAPAAKPAIVPDWGEEYLRLCMAVRVLGGLDEAIEHINRYSTKHSEAIITASKINAQKFLRLVDSAAVYWNASTRFTDGGEFGFGAEM